MGEVRIIYKQTLKATAFRYKKLYFRSRVPLIMLCTADLSACIAMLLLCLGLCRQWHADTQHACKNTGHLVDRQRMLDKDWTCSPVKFNISGSFKHQPTQSAGGSFQFGIPPCEVTLPIKRYHHQFWGYLHFWNCLDFWGPLYFGTSGRRSSRSAFRRSTGNNISSH